MQWNVLCINQANATTSQDISTISFDKRNAPVLNIGGQEGGKEAGDWPDGGADIDKMRR